MRLGLLNSAHSGYSAYLNAAIGHIEVETAQTDDATFHIEVATSHIAPATSHITPATIHMEVVASHTEAATSCAEDATAHIAPVKHTQRLKYSAKR